MRLNEVLHGVVRKEPHRLEFRRCVHSRKLQMGWTQQAALYGFPCRPLLCMRQRAQLCRPAACHAHP